MEPHELILSPLIVSILLINTVHFRYPSRFLSHMEAYDTSLLRSMRQAVVASDPLTVTFLKRWDDQFTPEVLAQATTALGELWNNEAAGICDALRWSVLCGHLQSISFVGAVLVPRGFLLHGTATGVQPRKDGLGTPPFLGFFYSYTLRRHPKTLNTNTAPSMRLLWGTLGPGLVMPNFGVFLETPFWARTPLGTPLPS